MELGFFNHYRIVQWLTYGECYLIDNNNNPIRLTYIANVHKSYYRYDYMINSMLLLKFI